jgi:hypothetical protein
MRWTLRYVLTPEDWATQPSGRVSFNNFASANGQGRCGSKANRLGNFHADHKLVLCRRLHWKVTPSRPYVDVCIWGHCPG